MRVDMKVVLLALVVIISVLFVITSSRNFTSLNTSNENNINTADIINRLNKLEEMNKEIMDLSKQMLETCNQKSAFSEIDKRINELKTIITQQSESITNKNNNKPQETNTDTKTNTDTTTKTNAITATTNTNTNTNTEENKNTITKQTKRMFFGILASYAHYDRREAIRATWLKLPKRNDWDYKFFLGDTNITAKRQEAEKERDTHNDIIFSPYVDNYQNLSYKVLYITKYATEHYNLDYVMKVDDDSFLIIDRLLDAADNYPREKFYGGIYFPEFRPNRDPGDIWHMPESLFPRERGPPMIAGPGYVLSIDCANMLAEVLAHPNPKLPVLPLEDVNTAVIMEANGVTPRPISEFLPGACPCSGGMFLSHWCGPDKLRYFYNNMQNGRLC